ncbi:hypothetical protein RFI_35528 [Reticulomyxa filosa]|uniref:Uncharacterized protein n=1 Tax=Reticulomyxa filosa TaxID=46433 RepID=X6LKP5_RETFI|nr:hypothetical protein RFI_35528 [Reticulomyxa filosa]|eukprot:ETO01911.1 hypothetical protein RFI_35528 [Reticulomyxa filosa]
MIMAGDLDAARPSAKKAFVNGNDNDERQMTCDLKRVSTKQNTKKKEKDNHDHNRLQIKDMNNTNKKDLNKEENNDSECNSRFPKCPSRRDI